MRYIENYYDFLRPLFMKKIILIEYRHYPHKSGIARDLLILANSSFRQV